MTLNYRKKVRLGDILLQKGIIDQNQLNKALAEQKQRGLMLGQMLVELGYVSQTELNNVLCEHLHIEFVDLRTFEPNENVLKLLDESIMRKYTLVPLEYAPKSPGILKVAMADPMNIPAIDDINIITGKQVIPFLANAVDIKAYLDRRFGRQQAQNIAEMYKKEHEPVKEEEEQEEKARKEDVENAPIVQLVNTMIEQAVRERASDIHIEPLENIIRVRFRVDGSLREAITYDRTLLGAIVARIKIIAGMDISERRKPQDGRITLNVDRREYDIRVSSLPTIYGEKIVMRIASKEGLKKEKSDLGMTENDLKKFNEILKNPNGIILVTGPTGSGKSTTLYTALNALNNDEVNIITVEDPVEANIDGVNQVQVNNKANLTFASALRSILRQDPDIIMIGEIRDNETAQIAVRASITGHLVVSTLHTNGTASSVARLHDMGVESYMISDSLVGIIAQRLIRKLCTCKKSRPALDAEKMMLGVPVDENLNVYEPCGCKLCNNTGYLGRTGIYEVMTITPKIKKMISRGAEVDEIRNAAIEEGMTTLRMAASKYVIDGVTSMAELIKATYEASDDDE
jgi:type IV pilus assembly protein PilB